MHSFPSTVYSTLTLLLDPVIARVRKRFSITYLGCEYTAEMPYKKEKCPKELKLSNSHKKRKTMETAKP